jgi:hypothetical protein
MIALEFEQGSPPWVENRLGIPTGSQADLLITPKTLKPSGSQVRYRNQLIAEWLLGHPLDSGDSGWTIRGTDMEEEARKWYAFTRDVDVEEVGFILRDDRRFGGSPDGLVGDDGLWEGKCPAAHTHIGYLLDPDSLVMNYRGQVNSYMHLTDRAWCDLTSYCPGLPGVLVRVGRDTEYLSAFLPILEDFTTDLEACKERLKEHKREPAPEPERVPLGQIVDDFSRWGRAG